MSPRRGAVAAGATMIVGLSSCGGGDQNKAAIGGSTPGPAAARTVTARVDGRTVSGHCRGERSNAPAVVLESQIGANQGQLAGLEELLMSRTLVCAYDRAGIGRSDPPGKTPRPMSELVGDLDAFVAAAKIREPHVLVGQFEGGNVAFAYAQTYPENVAGFVAMNPVPPLETVLPALKKVETAKEYAAGEAYHLGQNGEQVSFEEPMLDRPLPPGMPYAILFDDNCGGDTHCERVMPAVTRSTRALARVGDGGRVVPVDGAGDAIYRADPELVLQTVNEILKG